MIQRVRINYRARLGRGGEGSVFLAHSVETGRALAVKFHNALIPSVAWRSHNRELSRVRRVRGNNVARPVGKGRVGQRPFVVYEFAKFGSLRREMTFIF